MTDTDRINAMSFDEKLDHLRESKRSGIKIPAIDRSYRKLDFHSVWEIALGSMSRGEFQMMDKSAYNWALRHNVMDDVCGHMQARKRGPKS